MHEWPTFNIADAALGIGVALILIDRPRDNLPELDGKTDAAAPGSDTKQPA